MENLLSIITFLPMLGAAILVVFLRGNDEYSQRNAKILALLATIATFVLSAATMIAEFDPSNPGSNWSRNAHGWLA